MRWIKKGEEPASFIEWKNLESEDWQPTYANFQNPEKKLLLEALIESQVGRCCYCGSAIAVETSHIEHFKPQDSYENLELSFQNLFASCIRETNPGMPLHCGHAKGSAFSEELCISPLEPGCDERFFYTLHGSIFASNDDAGASHMIGLLDLDGAFLRNRRGSVLSKVFDNGFLTNVTPTELARLQELYRERDSSDAQSSGEFSHVLARYCGQLLG